MRKIYLLASFIFFVALAKAQTVDLTDQAEISILTIGPGTNLNDSFGHSAIRVKDDTFDYIFNYGVFDYNAPNFYLNFAQGKLNYWLQVQYFEDFLEYYIIQNRWVKEQVLDLSQEEKLKFFNYLMNNAKPENKYYLYDFFYDNCATKIKDVSNAVLNEEITFNTPKNLEPESFRALIHSHVNRNSWGSFGIDVALGSVIDQKATPEEHMFLPIFIYDFFAVATKSDGSSLVTETNVIFQASEQSFAVNFLTSPLMVIGIIALIILMITFKDFKNKTRSKWLDILLFLLTGIIGIVLLLLWFATDHTATANNYNLLWAFALNLFVIGQVFKTKVKTWFLKYLKLLLILLCLMCLHWIIGVQIFAIGLLPLVIALFIRYLYLIQYYKTNQTN